jgi:hypothetical protein
MDKYKNKKAELRAWAKDDIVPADLQWLCTASAETIEILQAELEQHRWIPVSESMPKQGQQVLLYWAKATLPLKITPVIWQSGRTKNECITHWKPIILPKRE